MLGENNNTSARIQSFFPFFHDDFKVIPGIDSVYSYTINIPHDISKIRHIKKRTLDHKAEISSGHDKSVQTGGFQQTHVIGNNDCRSFETGKIVQSPQMDFSAAAFGNAHVFQRIIRLVLKIKIPDTAMFAGIIKHMKIADIKRKTAAQTNIFPDTPGIIFRGIVRVLRKGGFRQKTFFDHLQYSFSIFGSFCRNFRKSLIRSSAVIKSFTHDHAFQIVKSQ